MYLRKLYGLSLVELMIGLLVGSIIVAGAIRVFSQSVDHGDQYLEINTLNQDLRAMMDVMLRDLRRAGFATNNPDSNADGVLDSTVKNNVFASIEVSQDQHCIAYQINKNANNPPVETNERLGFKMELDASAKPPKSVLRMRRSSTTLTCDSGLWENFTAPEVEITELIFELTETPLNISDFNINPTGPIKQSCQQGDACLYLREISIALSGRLVKNHAIKQSIKGRVSVRNHYFVANVP